MCGIFGFNFNDKNLLLKMSTILKHRGPDEKGFYEDESVSLGHRRLSIIDLSEKGKQPMIDKDGKLVLVFNGEIYNFKEIKKELVQKGYKFNSETDSEVILYAYKEYVDINNPKSISYFLNKLDGMFAFAIYDKRLNTILLVRDRLGKKPLYYYNKNNIFAFASEIKALLELKNKWMLEKEGLASFITYGHTIGEKTIIHDIVKVLGGQYILYNSTKLKKGTYWDIEEKTFISNETEIIKNTKKLLVNAVKKRLIADVTIGSFLSGGLDSSLITSIAASYLPEKINTYSVGFEDIFSELPFAKIVSEHINTNHTEININTNMAFKKMNNIIWHYDEPFSDSAVIGNYFLSREASKKVKVILNGEGGDEVFLGYPYHPKFAKVWKYLYRYNNFGLAYIIPKSMHIHNTNLNILSSKNMMDLRLNVSKIYNSKDLTNNYHLNPPNKPYFMKHVFKDPMNAISYIDLKSVLQERYLMKADKAIMAQSIEPRSPLLDYKLIEYTYKIPWNIKIKNNEQKYLLKKISKDYLPKEIILRKKTGFGVPIGSWLNTEFKSDVIDTLKQNNLIKQFVLDKHIKKIINNYYFNKNKRYESKLWNLYILGKWYEVFSNKIQL